MFKKMMMAGLMTATVLGGIAPAYAQRGDSDGGWRGRGNERAAGRAEGARDGDRQRGQSRGDATGRTSLERRYSTPAPAAQPRADRQRRGDGGQVRTERGDRVDNRREARSGWQGNRTVTREAQRDGRDRRDDRRDNRRDDRWRNDDRRSSGSWNSGRRYDDRTRWSGQRRWNNNWRNDRRYDWHSYRARYGDHYRTGRYYAPRGWDYGYRRYSIGIFLSSMLFANNYWIDDPWSYRLPPAYGTLRWVRYYDDALLVDIRDGYVVDVIHNFFW